MQMKRYLILKDGSILCGEGFGADAENLGELVFTTGMCGYIETLTDPSYAGQIVMQTFPLIGNYGIIESDFEGESAVRGYVVREWCEEPSNFRSQYTVDEFLKKRGIPGICGIDTRELTRKIRTCGVMNALITDALPDEGELPALLERIGEYRIENAVGGVTGEKKTVYPASGEKKYNVVLMDFGAKRNIISSLTKRGCEVEVVPAGTGAEEILALRQGGVPFGVMLSNGPGDPAENVGIIEEIGKLFGKVPMFGICLGHQLLALSQGGKTEKLRYGHRGVNQPVRDLLGVRTYITSQNHGYTVVSDSLQNGTLRYINANDGTCEGIDYPSASTFSVQFHPEAASGPRDTQFLFDIFCANMDNFR